MTKETDEFNELRAKVMSMEATIERMRDNFHIINVNNQEIDELKERINFLEDQVTAFRHEKTIESISTHIDYPPYFPYQKTTTPVESEFMQSYFQKIAPTKN